MAALHDEAATRKARVIPCGIDLERFKPLDPLECKRRLGWPADSFHVLFASSNGDPVKRPWLARAAVAQMARCQPTPQFHHLCSVPNEEVPVWLNAGDALLLTSLHEGSPTVVKEALACGLPVVSVNVGDVAERIEGIEGCYLSPPEPAALGGKLDLVRQRGRRLDCQPRLEELSILSVAAQLKRCYEEVTAAARAAQLRTPQRHRQDSAISTAARSSKLPPAAALPERDAGRMTGATRSLVVPPASDSLL